MAKKSNAAKIREYITANPTAKAVDVAKKFGTTPTYVYIVRSNMKLMAKPVVGKKDEWKTIAVTTATTPVTAPTTDMVNHPPHYKTGGIETIDFIEAKGLNYRLGNVVKYVARADHKGDRLENLKKAQWYLEREIAKHV